MYTLLVEGHPVLQEESDEILDEDVSVLGIPHKICVYINIFKSGEKSNKKCFASAQDTIRDLKLHLPLQNAVDFPLGDALIYDVHGNQLEDASSLSAAATFSTRCCRLNLVPQSEGAGAIAAARPGQTDPVSALAAQWRAVEVEPAGLVQHLLSVVEAALASGPDAAAEEQLEPSSYDAARQRLPSDTRPAAAAGPSPDLLRVRRALAPSAAASGASACPALGRQAVALIDALSACLGGSNAQAAARIAAAMECVTAVVGYLASRAPREHRHAAYAAQIC